LAQQMTEKEYRGFLAPPLTDGDPRYGSRRRPSPRRPFWFDLNGDTLIFATGENTVKGRNMRRDARVSLCIDDEEPPFHFVVIEGAAELTAEDPELLYWAARIGAR
jgi:hypothetical protein